MPDRFDGDWLVAWKALVGGLTVTIKGEFRRLMKRIGYEPIVPRAIPEWQVRRTQLFQSYGIDLVLDVGANVGQYAMQLRRDIHYRQRMISFEPLANEFAILQSNAVSDELWKVSNVALGDFNGQQKIHVAGNSYSSSMLDMMPAHAHAAPESEYIAEQTIEIRQLDSIFGELRGGAQEVYLKIDTQGFEGRVLKGGERSLEFINTVQMEMSLIPLYRGEMLFDELHEWMLRLDFALVGVEPGFADRQTGRLLQFDGIYHRY